MLRASARATGDQRSILTRHRRRRSGRRRRIPHGSLLKAFAEAALDDDEKLLTEIRQRLRKAMGDAALVDAAAVIANYSALDRVADATGIPLEPAKETETADLRAELGIDAWRSPALPGRSG